MALKFIALESGLVRDWQRGGQDDYENRPVRAVSDGGAIPCRHCLTPVEKGEPYLILAHRPFPATQPYAETGPIFVHEKECSRAADSSQPAPMHRHPGIGYILRGYQDNDWINYAAAEVVSVEQIAETAERLLDQPGVAYVHMRSSRYNCFQCRIERA